MTKRRGDKTPEPPGGRAGERLRQFLDARMPHPEPDQDAEDAEQEEPESEPEPSEDQDEKNSG